VSTKNLEAVSRLIEATNDERDDGGTVSGEVVLAPSLQLVLLTPKVTLVQRCETSSSQTSHHSLDDVEGLRTGVEKLNAPLSFVHLRHVFLVVLTSHEQRKILGRDAKCLFLVLPRWNQKAPVWAHC